MSAILDVDLSSDSEDDIDYFPDPVKERDSEDSSIADDESIVSDEDVNSDNIKGIKRKKVCKKSAKKKMCVETPKDVAVDEKKRANDLWATFLSDVDNVPPKKSSTLCCDHSTVETVKVNGNKAPKPKSEPISKIFEFAGETFEMRDDEKKVNNNDEEKGRNLEEINNGPKSEKQAFVPKRGLDSILGTIMNKHKKLNVLEKSKMDWKTFKHNEGIQEDLEHFNKGKQGYVERRRFLERADVRSFELEKNIRQTMRKQV